MNMDTVMQFVKEHWVFSSVIGYLVAGFLMGNLATFTKWDGSRPPFFEPNWAAALWPAQLIVMFLYYLARLVGDTVEAVTRTFTKPGAILRGYLDDIRARRAIMAATKPELSVCYYCERMAPKIYQYCPYCGKYK